MVAINNTHRNVKIKWTPVPDEEKVARYEIQVRDKAHQKLWRHLWTDIPERCKQGDHREIELDNLKFFTEKGPNKKEKNKYEVRVRGIGYNGIKGKWSKTKDIDNGDEPMPPFITSINIHEEPGIDGSYVHIKWEDVNTGGEDNDYTIGWFRGRDLGLMAKRNQWAYDSFGVKRWQNFKRYLGGKLPNAAPLIKPLLASGATAYGAGTVAKTAALVSAVKSGVLTGPINATPVVSFLGKPLIALGSIAAAHPIATPLILGAGIASSKTGRDWMKSQYSHLQFFMDHRFLKNNKHTITVKGRHDLKLRPEQIGKDLFGARRIHRDENGGLVEGKASPVAYYFYVYASNTWGTSNKAALNLTFQRNLPHPSKFNDKAFLMPDDKPRAIVYSVKHGRGSQTTHGRVNSTPNVARQ